MPLGMRAAAVIALLLSLTGAAFAHGLLLDAKSDGASIEGTLYYTNGDFGATQSVVLSDLEVEGKEPVSVTTDAQGNFRFPVTANRRYRIAAYGDEGHSVELILVAKVGARPQLIGDEQAASEETWIPPAWAVIGGALLLSLIPAFLIGRRKHGPNT
jgi:hypothetical protein